MKQEIKPDMKQEIDNAIDNAKKKTYELIKQQIKDRQITLPKMSVKELKNWLSAYAACQNEILLLLEQVEVYDRNGRGGENE